MLTNKNSSKMSQRKRTKKDIWIGMGKADASFLFSPLANNHGSRLQEVWMEFKDFERISREIGNEMETTLQHFIDTRVFMKREVNLKIYTTNTPSLKQHVASPFQSRICYVYRPVSPFERYYENKLFDAFLRFHHSQKWFVKGILWFRWIFFSSIKITRLLCLHVSEYLFVDCNRVKLVCLVYIVYSLRGIRLLCQFKWFSD